MPGSIPDLYFSKNEPKPPNPFYQRCFFGFNPAKRNRNAVVFVTRFGPYFLVNLRGAHHS
jgi:hypothetical protein